MPDPIWSTSAYLYTQGDAVSFNRFNHYDVERWIPTTWKFSMELKNGMNMKIVLLRLLRIVVFSFSNIPVEENDLVV